LAPTEDKIDETAMPLSAGTRLGSYEILALIGAGGMGEVYRATDSKLNRDVAIKVLPAALANDADYMARFQREAQVLASLNHPNIAAIYGLEDHAIVMELVPGETLAERIARGALPVEEAVPIAKQIAEALEAAHEQGIVHRDLKPGNVKITPQGVVKVLDFGLAKSADAASKSDASNSPTLTIRATHAGFILGTAAYMSPEQAAGKPVDHRADVWAFGVVLWEMLTGRRLFEGETVSHTLAAVLTKDPDWNQLPAATPQNVRRVLRRCLERDLKHRLRDIGDAWLELNTPDEPVATAIRKPSSLATRSAPWIAAALIAAAAIAWGLLRPPAANQPHPVIRSAFTQEQLFAVPEISRDGTRLVYTEVKNAALHLVGRMMDQLESRPIPGSENGAGAVFSPDGQWIAFAALRPTGGALVKMSATGGTPITLCEGSLSGGISWGDNHTIVFSDGKSLLSVNDAGGAPKTLTTPDPKKGEVAHVFPFLLPGANTVLFTITTSDSHQAAAADLKKGGYHVIVDNATNPRYISTGHLTYVRAGSLFAAPFDLGRLRVTGSETPVIQGVTAVSSAGFGEYTVSDNGVLVYMAGQGRGESVFGWVDRKGTQQALSQPQRWGNGRLSPDGLHVANSIDSGARSDIWNFDVERRTLTRLTFQGTNINPIWTHDGRRITFTGEVSVKHGIYSVLSDGSGKPELLLQTESRALPNSWTPDGKTLIYMQAGTDKKMHLWRFSVAGNAAENKPALLHDDGFGESGGDISPDGRYLAYVSNESGASEIYVQPFPGPGAKARISTNGGVAPRWSHTGRELFYWIPNPGGTVDRTALEVVDVQITPAFRAGLPQELFKLQVGTTWDVAPDGKRFLVEFIPKSVDLHMETVVNWFDELRRRVPAGGK
jgi:serine/threonine-protein kinase